MKREKGSTTRAIVVAASLMLAGIVAGASSKAMASGKKQIIGAGNMPCNATEYTCAGPNWVRVGIIFEECCCPTIGGPIYKCMCERAEFLNTVTHETCYRTMYDMYEVDLCTEANSGSGGSCLQ